MRYRSEEAETSVNKCKSDLCACFPTWIFCQSSVILLSNNYDRKHVETRPFQSGERNMSGGFMTLPHERLPKRFLEQRPILVSPSMMVIPHPFLRHHRRPNPARSAERRTQALDSTLESETTILTKTSQKTRRKKRVSPEVVGLAPHRMNALARLAPPGPDSFDVLLCAALPGPHRETVMLRPVPL